MNGLHIDLQHRQPDLAMQACFPAGAISAILGPSGSGKSSLLRLVAGLWRADRGRIQWHAKAWQDGPSLCLPTAQRPIGMVSQEGGLFPHLSALANVQVALQHLPRHQRKQRAQDCLALAHVSGLDDRLPHTLSGGQRQRVALARALARQPEVLLLDEPFSSLDRSTRLRLYTELQSIHAALGMTVLLVTHDLEEAATLAQHLVLVHRGRVVREGPLSTVLRDPGTETAARLLDVHNVFDGTLALEAQPTLHWGPYQWPVSHWRAGLPQGICRWGVDERSMRIHRAPPAGPDAQCLPATVMAQASLGFDTRLSLNVHGMARATLRARLPMMPGTDTALVGQEVWVELPRESIMCLTPN